MLSESAMWEEMSMRAVALTGYGGAQIGECQAAIDAVGDGGIDQWHDAWNSIARNLDDQGRVSAAVAGGISCPTLATTNETDPTSADAPKLLEAISGPGRLVSFTAAEGAAGHCEGLARRQFHERAYDWLEQTLP